MCPSAGEASPHPNPLPARGERERRCARRSCANGHSACLQENRARLGSRTPGVFAGAHPHSLSRAPAGLVATADLPSPRTSGISLFRRVGGGMRSRASPGQVAAFVEEQPPARGARGAGADLLMDAHRPWWNGSAAMGQGAQQRHAAGDGAHVLGRAERDAVGLLEAIALLHREHRDDTRCVAPAASTAKPSSTALPAGSTNERGLTPSGRAMLHRRVDHSSAFFHARLQGEEWSAGMTRSCESSHARNRARATRASWPLLREEAARGREQPARAHVVAGECARAARRALRRQSRSRRRRALPSVMPSGRTICRRDFASPR